MLKECQYCLIQCLEHSPQVNSEHSISERMTYLKRECKFRMQLCAINSQLQSHKEALEQALYSVSIVHQLIKDLYELCVFYTRRVDNEPQNIDEFSTSPLNSDHDFSPQQLNDFNQSISLHERTAIKLLPIMTEVINVLTKETDPYDLSYTPEKRETADMRSILGFLNQNEWVYELNIGTIMQIQGICNRDLLYMSKDEYELTRDSFLEKIAIVSVAYFCISTEQRFIINGKEEDWDLDKKEIESEYWHMKSLEIACKFLPSECPLLNHIHLGYQKHHAPAQYAIPEEEA